MRFAAQGKSFLIGGSPVPFRGVRYRSPSEPSLAAGEDVDQFRLDLASMAAAGYTVVSMPPPTASAIEHASASGLQFVLELDHLNADVLAAESRRERRRLRRDAAKRAQRVVHAWGASEALLGVSFGAVAEGRSLGRRDLALRAAEHLAVVLHDDDAGLLAAFRNAWPVDGGCPPEFDFLIVDYELSSRKELVPALMASHCSVGDRPLVLGHVSVSDAGHRGSPSLEWLIDTALQCGVGGTLADASSPGEPNVPASTAASIHQRTVRNLDVTWPSISIVVCAYNAETTLEECLSHCERLDYPKLEVIVVDDGSTDRTRAIAGAHPGIQLLAIAHGGLTVARNAGYRSAHGELIAYLDQDAYPSPEWPWYLALAALGDGVGAVGGPNIPPPDEPLSARVVSRSPGGPVPQLVSPDRAAHLPGCNMAFWRAVLEQLQGFDPVLATADDVEFQWRVVRSGYKMAYHPAALIWHHRRPGLKPYLRQQRNYGRGQAFLECRYPERFATGWRLRKAAARLRPHRDAATTEPACDVSYLSLPRHESAVLQLAHQWGMALAFVLVLTAPLGFVRRKLAAPAVAAATFAGALFAIDVTVAGDGRRNAERTLTFRARVAAFRLLRPLAFRWGHLSGWLELRVRARRP